MRTLALALLAAVAVPAAAAAPAPPPPILYVQGLQCPAHRSCTSDPAHFDRIREIPRIGFPSRRLSSGAFSDSMPAWSPDHRRIAFVRASHDGGASTLWVMNADGSGARRLTRGARADAEPTWSPDGSSIVFRGDSPDRRTFDLYAVPSRGGAPRNLTHDPDGVSVTDPDWSRARNLIVFERTKSGSGAGTGIYTIRPDGTGLERVLLGGLDPAWAPDGARIAYVAPEHGSSGVMQVWLASAAGTGKHRLTTGPETTAPAWSPDGTRLVCLRGSQIALVTVAGGHVKQLTPPTRGLAFVDTPAW